MSEGSSPSNLLLNLALGAAALVALVLLYGLATRWLTPRTDAAREANPTGLVGEIIQVEVRNACGVPGLAAEMRTYLRRHHFDVVEVGNHTSQDLAETVVVDRVGDPAAARKIAAALGLGPERVVEDVRLDLYLDATVLIGRDYAQLPPFVE